MPLIRPIVPFPVCPRCKAVLTNDMSICAKCGNNNVAKDTKDTPVDGMQSTERKSGFQGQPQLPGSNLQRRGLLSYHAESLPSDGNLQRRGLLSNYAQSQSPGNNQQAKQLPNFQAKSLHVAEIQARSTPVTGIQMGYPVSPLPVENTRPGMVHTERMPIGFAVNQVTTRGIQADAMQAKWPQLSFPNTHAPTNSAFDGGIFAGHMSNSVDRLNTDRPVSISISESTSYSAKNDQHQSQLKRALIYFVCVVLATSLLIFIVFNESGLSLLSLISHPASTNTVTLTYTLPKTTPLLTDTFHSDASGWNLQSVPGSYQVTVGNGKLTLEDDKNTLLWELLPGEQTYGNFLLSVNATLSKGDPNNGYGVYIRGTSNAQSDLATYYRFELYGDSSYAIFKGVTNQSGASTEVKLTNFFVNSAIQKQGKPNHIMLIAKGSSLSFIVNGHLLTALTDHSYARGSIAFFVSNLPGSLPEAQAQFSQLAIYQD